MAWLSVALVPALRCVLSAFKKILNQIGSVIPSNRSKDHNISLCASHTGRLKASISPKGMPLQ